MRRESGDGRREPTIFPPPDSRLLTLGSSLSAPHSRLSARSNGHRRPRNLQSAGMSQVPPMPVPVDADASADTFVTPSTVLIVDDNPQNVELLVAFLESLPVALVTAVDGVDALAKVAEHKPDLILLDVMMPRMSGFQVCQKLKADPATRDIQILMVTALHELGDIERATECGTDDFVSKPPMTTKASVTPPGSRTPRPGWWWRRAWWSACRRTRAWFRTGRRRRRGESTSW